MKMLMDEPRHYGFTWMVREGREPFQRFLENCLKLDQSGIRAGRFRPDSVCASRIASAELTLATWSPGKQVSGSSHFDALLLHLPGLQLMT